ncbi:MAG: hypothetical protein H7Y86_08155 [Rhizobacter sp.]|nr:hypothetical protein [Ferruginibacter sp.]
MKPLAQIVLSLILTFVICQLAYLVINKGTERYYIHKEERLTELFKNRTTFDVLFVGSSRTHTSINPKIVDSVCQLHSYNAGVEGGNLLEFKMTIEAYLQNHPPPAMLLLTLDINSFDLKRPFFNYSQYLPFVKNRVINQTLNNNGHRTALIKLLPFMKIASYDDYMKGNALKGLKGNNEIPEGEYQYKGYMTNTQRGLKDTQVIVTGYRQAAVAAKAVDYLDDIIKRCSTNKIKLLFSYAPEFKNGLQDQFSNKEEVFNLVDSIAVKNNITYFRDDKLSLCTEPELFANFGHVNRKGADKYSMIVAERLCDKR